MLPFSWPKVDHDTQVLELIATRLALEDRMDLNMFLDMLGSHIGTLLLCGRLCLSWRYPFICTWTDMPLRARELAMLSWAASPFSQLRKARAAGCGSEQKMMALVLPRYTISCKAW